MENFDDNIRSLFMETLRFGSLNIIHAKKLVNGSSWKVNRIMNTNELFFVCSGGFHLVIDEQNYYVDKNKMVCIPANIYRDIYIEKDGFAEFYTMQFYAEAGGGSYFNYVEPMSPVDMTEYKSEIERLMDGMVDIGEPMSHSDVLRRIGLAGEVLALFFEVTCAKVKVPERKSHINFGKVMAHIDRNYRYKKLTVAELAAVMKVSEGYFRREFKKEYGMSCKMYIDSLRTEGVLRMLRESDATLKSIAENFRYSDISYLSRVVKKRTGMSPTEYRHKHKTRI